MEYTFVMLCVLYEYILYIMCLYTYARDVLNANTEISGRYLLIMLYTMTSSCNSLEMYGIKRNI